MFLFFFLALPVSFFFSLLCGLLRRCVGSKHHISPELNRAFFFFFGFFDGFLMTFMADFDMLALLSLFLPTFMLLARQIICS